MIITLDNHKSVRMIWSGLHFILVWLSVGLVCKLDTTTENTDNIPTLSNYPLPDMPPIQVYPQGIQHLLNNLDAIKSGSPDKLPARFLKEVATEVAPTLSIIYQASLDQGVLPVVWKTAAIVPIYKRGSRTACRNYRPISLTCICSKVRTI